MTAQPRAELIRARSSVAVALYLAVFIEGLMLALPGPTLDVLSDATSSGIAQIGAVFTANGLGFVLGALVAGRWYARLKGNWIVAASLLTMALATSLVPSAQSLAVLLGLFVVIGAAIGLIDVGANTLLIWEYGERVPPFLNALHLFWGVGAFTAPLIVALLDQTTGRASATYWLFAALMVPAAIWLALSPVTSIPPEAGPGRGSILRRRHSKLVAMIGVLFFLHVGAELSFGGWIFSFASAADIGADTTARLLNSVFWGGLVLGRLVAIPLSLRISARLMIWLDLVGAALGLGIVAFLVAWEPSIWVGTALFGVSIASIFASCINYAGGRVQITSSVTSIFLVGASLGSMTLPWVTGVTFERAGSDALTYVVGITIGVAGMLFAVITRYSRRIASSV